MRGEDGELGGGKSLREVRMRWEREEEGNKGGE